jgi:hypothetical protein
MNDKDSFEYVGDSATLCIRTGDDKAAKYDASGEDDNHNLDRYVMEYLKDASKNGIVHHDAVLDCGYTPGELTQRYIRRMYRSTKRNRSIYYDEDQFAEHVLTLLHKFLELPTELIEKKSIRNELMQHIPVDLFGNLKQFNKRIISRIKKFLPFIEQNYDVQLKCKGYMSKLHALHRELIPYVKAIFDSTKNH